MRTKSFSFDLPPELVAQYPADRREEARLLVLRRADGGVEHRHVHELPALLPARSLLVLNDSRVRKARIPTGRRDGGSTVELLFVERLDVHRWLVTVNKAKRQRPGTAYDMPGGVGAKIVELRKPYRVVETTAPLSEEYFERFGLVPLPPYIKRRAEPADEGRYQSVFASNTGSIAAPTAGLHFTEPLLSALRTAGHDVEFITLHVGLGTFVPVRTEHVEEHAMHEERFTLSQRTAESVHRAREAGRPIVAVGTTTVRALESAMRPGAAGRPLLAAGTHTTSLFIYPGYEFSIVDSMFTNFHTPESSLLMLVSAFAGRSRILAAYEEAIRRRYRFYSYGDAMLIR